MPQPLPDAMVATLRADPCAALAAIMIIANAHSELLAWAQRTIGAFAPGTRECHKARVRPCATQRNRRQRGRKRQRRGRKQWRRQASRGKEGRSRQRPPQPA